MLRSRVWAFTVVPLSLLAAFGVTLQGQQPSVAPPAGAVTAAVTPPVEIVGRVETHDNTVIGIAVPSGAAPAVGDSFDVLLTTPAGERGRVGRGKLTFVKNGVALGRLDEATGELAIGLEVRIQAANPQPRDAATPAPGEQPTASPPAAAVDVSKAPGVFLSEDPQFPFVLQVETRGDFTLVRGLGRMAYSADDPTPISVAFQGIGPAGGRTAVRGAMTLQPDEVRQIAPLPLPWVGLYDAETDGWQTMLSPNHFAGTARSGSSAARAKKGNSKDADKPFRRSDLLRTLGLEGEAQLLDLHDLARDAAVGIQSRTPPTVRAQATSVRDNLRSSYTDLVQDMADFGTRISQGITGSGAKPPPVNPSDPFTGKPLDQVLGAMWARGMTNDRLSSVLVAAPDPARAWQVTRVTRLPDGRIEIVNYGNAPDGANVAQGGNGASGGSNTGGPNGNSTGTGGSAGGGTQPGGTGGAAGGSSTSGGNSSGNTASTGGARSGGPTGGASNPGNPGQSGGGSVAGAGNNSGVTSGTGTPPSSAGGGRSSDSITTDDSGRVSGNRSPPPPSGPGGPARPPLTTAQALDGLLDYFRGPNSPLNPPPPSGPGTPANPPNTPPPSGPGTPGNPPTVTNPPPSTPGGPKPPSTPPPPPPVASSPGPRSGLTLPTSRSRDPQVYDPNVTVLVNDDSGQAPTPALTAAQINAARAALNRASAASGVMVQAKGPKADGDRHHEATEHDRRSLAGTWELTARVGGLQSATHTITVAGRTVQLRGSSTDIGGGAATYSGEGTLTDQGNGTSRADLTLTYNSVGAETESITLEVSNDGSTMTTRSANGTLTWRRTSPAASPPKPGAGEHHHDAPAAAPASSGGAAHHTPPPATTPAAPTVGGKPARYSSLTGNWKCSCGETWSLQQQGQNIVGQESMDGRLRRLQGTFAGGRFRFAFRTTDGEQGQGVMVPDADLKRMNWRMTLSTGESWDGSVERQ